MLSEKPWKPEEILRLGASVLVCMFAGAMVSVAIEGTQVPPKANPELFFSAAIVAIGLFAGALLLLNRPWQPDWSMLLLLGCVYGGIGLLLWDTHVSADQGLHEQPTWKMLVTILSFQGAALVLVYFFLRGHGMNWNGAFGFNSRWKRAVVLGAATAVAATLVIWTFQWGLQQALEHFHVENPEQTAVQVLRSAQSWFDRTVLGVVTIIVVPPAEEIMFRGILYPTLKQSGYPRLALWGSSILFGAIHLNLGTFLPLTALALVLVWLYEKTGNLLASITTHSLFNAMNFAMLYAMPWLQNEGTRWHK